MSPPPVAPASLPDSPGWALDARAAGAWQGARVCVAGVRLVGQAVGRVLAGLGASVVAVDDGTGEDQQRAARELERRAVTVRLGDAATLPEGVDLLVASPGFRPDSPLLAAAAAAGVPVWGDVELAWRLRDPAVPWLCVTGTNGKTTAVRMLAAMVAAAGYRTVAAGNVGLPLLDVVLAEPAYQVLVVELSSFQLHYTSTVAPYAGAVLNVAPDHLDWHGSMEAYAADKARIWQGSPYPVHNADDAWCRRLVAGRAGATGFTLGPPRAGQLGVVAGRLVDAAFPRGGGRSGEAGEERAAGADVTDAPDVTDVADVADVTPPAPHNVANALAAAALVRALGESPRFPVPAQAVRAGLRAYRPDAHRIARVATVEGVAYVDDSKATNAHAAAASLRAFDSVVWVAGGLAKGARFDELAAGARGRLRAAVLLGQDRALLREALARSAPEVPVVDIGDDLGGGDAMDAVVREAARLARPGDTVLLAPACASMDMFASYAARGDAFAAAVARLAAGAPSGASAGRGA